VPSSEREIILAPLPTAAGESFLVTAPAVVAAFAVATYTAVAASLVVAFGVDSALAVEPVAALAVETVAAFVVAFDVKPTVESFLVVGPSVDVVSRGRVRSRTRGTVHIRLLAGIL
jgi:hypothetical protein